MRYDKDIRDARNRIKERCPEISTTKHQNTFNNILLLNRYPENNIKQSAPKTIIDATSTNTVVSEVSERLNHKITNIFYIENI